MKKGLFLVLDGNDGSGKATQSKLLVEYLEEKGISAERVDFPAYDRNFFGGFLGECLAGEHGDFVHLDPKIASSLYALDRFESTPKITHSLEEGKIVIADRFSSSNQIHQGGKIADVEERKKFLRWLEVMEHEKLSIPRPDTIIYLKVPLGVSLELLQEKRTAKNTGLEAGQKDTVEEDREYLERSHDTAHWLSTHQPNWYVIDCEENGKMRSRESIHEEIVSLVQKLLSLA